MGGKFSKKKILHLILHQCVALFVKNVDCMTFKKNTPGEYPILSAVFPGCSTKRECEVL